MKKIITLLLLITMLISMASCEKKNEISTDNNEEVIETETEEEAAEEEATAEEASAKEEEVDEVVFVSEKARLSDLDIAMIKNLLYRCYKYGGSEGYDSQNAGDSWLLSNMVAYNLVDFDRYPVDIERDNYGGAVNDMRKDPRGKVSKPMNDGGWWASTKGNKDAVDWVAKNIFNATDEDIKEMLEKAESEDVMYLQDGYYYSIVYPGGGQGVAPKQQVKVDKIGQVYSIEYTLKDFKTSTYYALMTKKRINSEKYWSIYYFSQTPPNDVNIYGPQNLRFSDGETYTVIAKEGVVVRSGPGKSYHQISYAALTDDEGKQAIEGEMAVIKEGGEVKCYEMEGDWMRINSGWICTYDDGEELVR